MSTKEQAKIKVLWALVFWPIRLPIFLYFMLGARLCWLVAKIGSRCMDEMVDEWMKEDL
jgi:hypothetical protein